MGNNNARQNCGKKKKILYKISYNCVEINDVNLLHIIKIGKIEIKEQQ